jgi:hypothetical protein
MTHSAHVGITLAAALLISTVAAAQEMPKPKTESVTLTATIEAIDKSNRLVTLKGEKGNVVTVHADETVKRFDELKVGDKVTATYYESLAVNVRKPGDPAPPAGTTGGVTPRTGGPGATAAMQDTITVTVQSVDLANRSVTVRKQDGSVVSMRVENPQYLQAVKAGDTVDITYTRALLLKAEPAK